MPPAAISPSSIHRTRIRSPSPSNTYQRSPSPSAARTLQSSRLAKPAARQRRSSQSKENEPVHDHHHEQSNNSDSSSHATMETLIPPPKSKMNGRAASEEKDHLANGHGNGVPRSLRDVSAESDDTGAGPSSTIRSRRSQTGSGSGTTPKRQSSQQSYNGLPTLPTIGDDDNSAFLSSGPPSPSSPSGRAPPPAPSAHAAMNPNYGQLGGSGVRRRRASSIKRKLSPGVTPTKAVDWEIPRKVFHSSIGESTDQYGCKCASTITSLVTLFAISLMQPVLVGF